MNPDLFSEFDPVTAKQWKQQIQADLKGGDYNKTLVWESPEGIKVKPFYTAEDLADLPRFSPPDNHQWSIAQAIYAGNTTMANKKALNLLHQGAGSLIFQVPHPQTDWQVLLKDIPIHKTPVYFYFDFLDIESIQKLQEITVGKKARGYLNIDLIGHLCRTGNWYFSQQKDNQLLHQLAEMTKGETDTNLLGVDISMYQNAGANLVQQLAYGLAHADLYVSHFTDHNIPFPKNNTITFKVSMGSNYFFEIAKLRALRWIWKALAEDHGLHPDCHILAMPTKRNKTLYDYNVNMLRTTSECMSAVLGGADVVCNLPYDTIFHKDNEFGDRIARNQLLLLKEESYLDEAVSAADGNYYIEYLTDALAKKALELFSNINKAGGLLKQLKASTLQRKIRESAAKEQALFDKGELVLVGTNAYQNPSDGMKGELQLYPFVKTGKRKTEIEPLMEKRLAEAQEKERLAGEDIS